MKQKSFTLIEILVVIVVIGVLSAFILVGMSSITSSANIAKGKAFVNSMDNSLLLARASLWKLDESSGTAANDSWGSNNAIFGDGTCSSGTGTCPTITTSQCVSNNCLSFDGSDDYINVPHNLTIKPTTAISFGGWGYSATWTGLPNSRLLSCTEGGGYNITFSGSTVYIYLYRNAAYATPTGSLSSLSGGWHYFLGTYDGRYTKVYIDGIQVGTADDAGATYPIGYACSNSLMIGAEAACGNTPYYSNFLGKIDDVRIYNQAIPTSEIQQNYFVGINKLFKNNGIGFNEFNQKLTELKNNLADN